MPKLLGGKMGRELQKAPENVVKTLNPAAAALTAVLGRGRAAAA